MSKEYAVNKCKPGGPSFPHCTCCNPHVGFLGNGKAKPMSHRIVRRKAKQEVRKNQEDEE